MILAASPSFSTYVNAVADSGFTESFDAFGQSDDGAFGVNFFNDTALF
jgi:hypothetical protein